MPDYLLRLLMEQSPMNSVIIQKVLEFVWEIRWPVNILLDNHKWKFGFIVFE